MKNRNVQLLLVLSLLCACSASGLLAMQQWGYGRRGQRGRDSRAGVPRWNIDQSFPSDAFTFARVRYSEGYGYGGGGYRYGRRGRWSTDYPDSDLNFSLRLQQLTALKVNPDPVVIDLTDPELFDYPFLYMIEPGRLVFSGEEVTALRKYLTNGGFMMVDDFWGPDEWNNFYREIKRVFPEREAKDVPLEHEIFQCVYPLKEKPQVPSIHAFYGGSRYEYRRGDTVKPITKRFRTTRAESWFSSAITPTSVTAGNARGKTTSTFRSTLSRSRIPWVSTLLPTP